MTTHCVWLWHSYSTRSYNVVMCHSLNVWRNHTVHYLHWYSITTTSTSDDVACIWVFFQHIIRCMLKHRCPAVVINRSSCARWIDICITVSKYVEACASLFFASDASACATCVQLWLSIYIAVLVIFIFILQSSLRVCWGTGLFVYCFCCNGAALRCN